MSRPDDRLIVALDVGGYDDAARLVTELSPYVSWFKLGSVLFTREGPRICQLVKNAGAKLFLDLKFHDIPNTVRGAVKAAISLDADMITVHTSGGRAMLEAAADEKRNATSEVIIVGVTVLTHLDLDEFRRLFESRRPPAEAVLALGSLARDSGLDGIVASARELPMIREHLGPDFTVVTPGIRLADTDDDQVRVVTPQQAIADGASYLVVGRPVIAAADPADACRRIIENMKGNVRD